MAVLSKHFETIVTQINENLGGLTIKDIKTLGGGHIKYTVYPNAEYMKEDLNALELSVRAVNGLRRAGYHSVADVVNAASCNVDLARIRQLGKKSVEEIMLGIFLFQYMSLASEKRGEYLKDLLSLNGIVASPKI